MVKGQPADKHSDTRPNVTLWSHKFLQRRMERPDDQREEKAALG